MELRLENLVPLPLVESRNERSEIWGAKACLFQQGKHYLVKANSGTGKTTLLSTLYGLRKDYNGKYLIDGRPASELSSKEWSEYRKQKISHIFQGLELFGELGALDNILLKNKITGHKSLSEIKNMAERLGLGKHLHKKCNILSFGQQQRVAIIRALCQPFDFLFADECFSHLDAVNSKLAHDLIIEECATKDAGFILTSLGNDHNQFDHSPAL